MISSTSLRSFPKTCGLFDTGFAGDDQQITSIVPNAPADVLSEFNLGGQDSRINLIDPSYLDSDDIAGSLIKDSQLVSEPTLDEDNWDLLDLDDLSADPLGDDSLDAFINLDKYLTGNSFFDEDGNLVKETEEVNPVISIPTIQEFDQDASELMPNSDTQMVQNTLELVPSTSVDVSPLLESSVTGEQMPCKRKRKAKFSSVKTSLFEIQDSAADNQLDHDYISKRLKLSVKLRSAPNSSNSSVNNIANDIAVIDSVNACEVNSSMSLEPPLDKQSLRRLKNNVASKRSREQRKQKFVEMDKEAEELVIKNDQLRKKIAELEKLAGEMKKVLVAKMAGN